MASIIKIKRSGTSAAPSSLKLGEMAYSYYSGTGGHTLYIGANGADVNGDANDIVPIGGRRYVRYLTDSANGSIEGTLTANKAIIVDGNSKIDVLNVDNITINGNTISTTDVNGNLLLSPNGTGTVTVPAGYSDRAGFGTNSLATKEYIDDVAGAKTITINGDVGTDTANLKDSAVSFTGGTGIETAVTNNNITFNLSDTTVSPGTYGSAGSIPSITIDQQGRITSASSVSVSTNLAINGDASSTGDVNLLDSEFTIAGGTGITTTMSGTTLTVSGDNATTTTKGVASFSSSDFSVSAGAVSIATGGISNAQLAGSIANSKLANSTITIDDGVTQDAISLGGTLKISGDTSSGTVFTVNGGDSATISVNDATSIQKGVASFSSSDFSVTSGAVTIKTQGVSATQLENTLDLSGKSVTLAAGEISNSELANSNITINGTAISLGGSGTIDTDDISEGSTNQYYTTARADSDAKRAVSVTDAGGDGSLSYDNSTGVFTYTGPSATEVRAHLVAGTGVTYDSANGRISIGQAVGTTDSVTFSGLSVTNNVVIDGNLQVNGTQTIISSETLSVADAFFYLNQLESAGSPTIAIDVGFAANYNDTGSYAHTGFFRDATDGTWKLFDGYTPEPDSDLDIDIDHSSFEYADLRVGALTATSITGPYAGFDSDLGSAFTDALSEGTFNLYYTTDRVDSALGDILVAGTGIAITDGNLTYTISGTDAAADGSTKGIATYNSTNFSAASGVISSNDITLNGGTGSAAATLGESFTITGTAAQGISTSATGTTVTITAANAAADGSTKGVAAFNSTHFSAASGIVSANDLTLYSGNTNAGQGAGIAATVGESFNIYGDWTQGLTSTITSGNLVIQGRNATRTSKGVASFGAYADSAGEGTRQFTLTSGDVELTTVDGGTY